MEDGLGGYSIKVNPVEAVDEGEWKCVATSAENVKQFTTCYVAMSSKQTIRSFKRLNRTNTVGQIFTMSVHFVGSSKKLQKASIYGELESSIDRRRSRIIRVQSSRFSHALTEVVQRRPGT